LTPVVSDKVFLGSNESSVIIPHSGTKRSITSISSGISSVSGGISVAPERQVVVELLFARESIDVTLIFEGFPVWLLGLDPCRIGHICIVGYADRASLIKKLTARHQPGYIVNRLLKRFGVSRTSFSAQNTSPKQNTLTLVSGTIHYIDSLVSTLSQFPSSPVIGVLDHHFHGRLRNGRPSNLDVHRNEWSRVLHETVGGVTRFVGLFCSSMELLPVVSTLRRTLHHVVDFGLRPVCVKANDPRLIRALTLKHLLHPSFIQQPITYPTHFCCSGVGYRSLTANELATVFGFPVITRVGGLQLDDFESFLPSQLLHAILDSPGIKPRSLPVQTPSIQVKPRLPLYAFPCETRSWIPSVQHWLPHVWIDTTLVTSKAAKRDDARIATAMWDQRLLLLYPMCSVSSLTVLRSWLLRYSWRLLLRGLWRHLAQEFGSQWSSLLSLTRQIDGTKYRGKLKDKVENLFCQHSSWEPERLLLEGKHGVDVVNHYTDASWWEWSRGSALVFWRREQYYQLALNGCPPFCDVQTS
jgi:hypothetical protein